MSEKLDFFIIDDSDVNNYYTEDLLNEFDFTNSVSTFLKAREGLNALIKCVVENQKLPEIVLLDIRMPEMDGFEFIEELDEELEDRDFDSKIFILTSSKHRRDVEAFDKQEIACEFLSKPLDKAEILSMVEKHFS